MTKLCATITLMQRHGLAPSAARGFSLFLAMALACIGAWANPAQEVLSRDYPVVFKDMGVVQNKAMSKAGRFLFAPTFSMDLSDGPFGMYGIGARVGYALSDFWEAYLVANPKFLTPRRAYVKSIDAALAAQTPPVNVQLTGAIARAEYGIQLLWAPLYGKDSLGISRIIRSDTFFRLGATQLTYDSGSGIKLGLGLGKTFFLGKSIGFRILFEQAMVQTIYQGAKAFNPISYIESGLVFYF